MNLRLSPAFAIILYDKPVRDVPELSDALVHNQNMAMCIYSLVYRCINGDYGRYRPWQRATADVDRDFSFWRDWWVSKVMNWCVVEPKAQIVPSQLLDSDT